MPCGTFYVSPVSQTDLLGSQTSEFVSWSGCNYTQVATNIYWGDGNSGPTNTCVFFGCASGNYTPTHVYGGRGTYHGYAFNNQNNVAYFTVVVV